MCCDHAAGACGAASAQVCEAWLVQCWKRPRRCCGCACARTRGAGATASICFALCTHMQTNTHLIEAGVYTRGGLGGGGGGGARSMGCLNRDSRAPKCNSASPLLWRNLLFRACFRSHDLVKGTQNSPKPRDPWLSRSRPGWSARSFGAREGGEGGGGKRGRGGRGASLHSSALCPNVGCSRWGLACVCLTILHHKAAVLEWGVSPAAQMGCLRNRSGSPSGADQP